MKRINVDEAYFVAFVILAIGLIGIFDAAKDTLSHHYSQSIFTTMNSQFWDASVSWCNKWSDCEAGKERFPLSSSALVFLTDGWHFCKFMTTRLSLLFPALFLGIIVNFNSDFLDRWYIKCFFFWLLLGFYQGSIFHLFYHYILIK
jgi:hypothetical protein